MFSGFVFRGDTRAPEIIFKEGFVPSREFDSGVSLDDRMDRMTGNLNNGFTFGYGVSTALSALIAAFYTKRRSRNYVTPIYDQKLYKLVFKSIFGISLSPTYDGYTYLIDARDFSGYAIPVPPQYRNRMALKNEWRDLGMLKEIYEVNFIHALPSTSIVGAIWSDAHVMDKECKRTRAWGWQLEKLVLTLGENPDYDGDAASVAKLFE